MRIAADSSGLSVLDCHLPPGAALTLRLSGRDIWSFEVPARADESTAAEPSSGGSVASFTVPWPAALAPRLTGPAVLSLRGAGGLITDEVTVVFDDSPHPFELADPTSGALLSVNKWGRLAQPFDSRDPGLVEEILDETERLIAFLSSELAVDLFVTGGTLLGPVRNGRIMPKDDDSDLAYLSRHDNPSDVVLESFAMERALLASGYEVVRHSSAHLQLMFPGGALTDRFYIDIFSYFVCNGWFYGPFHARQPAADVSILPLVPLPVNGRQLPGPRDPASLLAAIYGPTWRVPNPAFRFETPPAAARRFFWWLNHFDVDRENWEDHHRLELASSAELEASQFATQVASRLPEGSTVIDLGCGLGTDSRYFASRRHSVLAVDYSRPALVSAATAAARANLPVRHLRMNLNMARDAVRLRSIASGMPGPHHLYCRRLFDALPPVGWDVTLQLLRSELRSHARSRALVEIGLDSPMDVSTWTEFAGVDESRMREQLRRYDLEVEEQDLGVPDTDGTPVNRITVRARR